MAYSLLEALLAWVSTHPYAALGLVFGVALGESLFLFGLLIPGALFMFAFGALIGADAMPLGATFTAAIFGTLVGDGASFAFGRRYRDRLNSLAERFHTLALLTRGQAFLARHGGKGIVLGRLIGALRPIMPTVAGAAGMPPLRFVVMDVLATAAWAPCYILPGVVFGASLDLAAQVATRLAIVVLGVAFILWAAMAAVRFIIAVGSAAGRRHAERLLAWSRRHRRLGMLGPALADPRQPELPALAVAAGLLMLATGILYCLVWGLRPPFYPSRLDALALYLSQSLHTPISNTIARFIADIGSPLIYLPFAAVIAGLLLIMGNRRAAGHWAAALGCSATAVLLLRWWLNIPSPRTLFYGQDADPLFRAGGGQDLILCATVYGLAGMILASRRPDSIRPYYYSTTVAGVVLIALARFYLALDWASDLIIGLTAAFVWLNLLQLSYRRQQPHRVRRRPVLFVLSGSVAIAGVLAVLPRPPLPEPARSRPAQLIDHWKTAGYRRLDARIRDIEGRPSAPLNIQAAGNAERLSQALARAGWHAPPRLGPGQPLHWLAPGSDIQTLAVLPRIHDGRRAALTRVHAVTGSAQTNARWVLRLWPSGGMTRRHSLPLWVGTVDYQRLDHRLNLLVTAVDQRDYDRAQRVLAGTLSDAGLPYRQVHDRKQARLLFWSPLPPDDAKVSPDRARVP